MQCGHAMYSICNEQECMNTTRSIFITGAGGFITPHLLDRLDPSCLVTLHVRDLAKATRTIKPRPGLQIISGALTKREILNKLPPECDAVIHLAGAVHGPNTEAILDSNIVTTQNALDIMEARRIPKMIFMSTASVWSDSAGVKLSEATETNPTTLYGYAKLAAERLIADAVTQEKIASAVVLRCNNTYGPGGVQGAVANFMACLLNGAPVQIQGDGQQLREPLYVSDLVDVLLKSFSKDRGLHTYGISGPDAMTVLAMAQSLAKVAGKEIEVDWKPENSDRARHIMIDTAKARRELGWCPSVHYEEGCTRYYNSQEMTNLA
jgi:nucleoside-diphosphate-sugar epimerase